jgi:hypothetical protein
LGCSSIVNKLHGTAVYDALISAGNDTWINYEVTAAVLITATAVTHEAAIVVRLANSNNFYVLGLGCYGYKYCIFKKINGVDTVLASSGVIGDVAHNITYTLKAVCEGSTLELWEGGAKVLTVTDSSLTSGSIGLRTYNSDIEVASMSATDLSSNWDFGRWDVAVWNTGAVSSEQAFFMLNRRK